MELRDGMFAVKVCELERQYGLLQTRLELCQGAGHEKIRDILQDELNDYRENALLMERRAEGSRSPAVAELVSAQVRERVGIHNIVIDDIGIVIGAHSGPGTVALFFFGKRD